MNVVHVSYLCFLQGSIHASLTSSSKMAAISSVLLAAAASEEEESAESILERHMSLVFSGPDTETSASTCHSTHHRGVRTTSGDHRPDNYSARHAKSSSLTHSQSAAEGNWSSSDHRSLSDNYRPPFRTSASFGDGDLSRSKLCQPNSSEVTRADHERMTAHVHSMSAMSKHHQQRHLLPCPHTDSERK